MGSGVSVHSDSDMANRDDFIFSSTIGTGGFSIVQSTMHVPSKTWMALKETSIKGICKHKKGISMLASEVKILAHLSTEENRFIVNLHFAFRDNQKCYMALDLHPGGDLRYHIKNKRAFSEKVVAFYTICLSSALHFIHEKGILHRDVKPENIILDAQGFPFLTDFGVSTMSSTNKELLCTGSSGTRQYLAPEVFTESHRHGVEADFWSLGVMIYELVYGRRPFSKHCHIDMIQFHEDLQRHKVSLSSTSSKFAKIQGMSLDEADFSVEWTRVYMDNPMPIDGSYDEREHWTHIASTIKDNKSLSEKVEILRRDATLDALVDEHHYACDNNASSNKTYSKRNCNETAIETFLTRRKRLPKCLRVSMPKYSQSSKRVSLACMSVLEGFLDVRLWTRLGAGNNYLNLKQHAWFEENNLIWKDVEEGRVLSPFMPNVAKVTRDLAYKHDKEKYIQSPHENAHLTKTIIDRNFNKLFSTLSSSDRNVLQNFHYVAPRYYDVLEDEDSGDDTDCRHNQSKGSTITHSNFVDSSTYTCAPPTALHSE